MREIAKPSAFSRVPAAKPAKVANVHGLEPQTLAGLASLAGGGYENTHFQVLRPYDAREALTLAEAGRIADRHPETVRLWCERHHIGRKVVGTWQVSRVALCMLLDDDPPALRAYLAGDRAGPRVRPYLERAGLV